MIPFIIVVYLFVQSSYGCSDMSCKVCVKELGPRKVFQEHMDYDEITCLGDTRNLKTKACNNHCYTKISFTYDIDDSVRDNEDFLVDKVMVVRDCSSHSIQIDSLSKCSHFMEDGKQVATCKLHCLGLKCNTHKYYRDFVKDRFKMLIPTCIQCEIKANRKREIISNTCTQSENDMAVICFGKCYDITKFDNRGHYTIQRGCSSDVNGYALNKAWSYYATNALWTSKLCNAELYKICNTGLNNNIVFFKTAQDEHNAFSDLKKAKDIPICLSCESIREDSGLITNCDRGIPSSQLNIVVCKTKCISSIVRKNSKVQIIRGCIDDKSYSDFKDVQDTNSKQNGNVNECDDCYKSCEARSKICNTVEFTSSAGLIGQPTNQTYEVYNEGDEEDIGVLSSFNREKVKYNFDSSSAINSALMVAQMGMGSAGGSQISSFSSGSITNGASIQMRSGTDIMDNGVIMRCADSCRRNSGASRTSSMGDRRRSSVSLANEYNSNNHEMSDEEINRNKREYKNKVAEDEKIARKEKASGKYDKKMNKRLAPYEKSIRDIQKKQLEVNSKIEDLRARKTFSSPKGIAKLDKKILENQKFEMYMDKKLSSKTNKLAELKGKLEMRRGVFVEKFSKTWPKRYLNYGTDRIRRTGKGIIRRGQSIKRGFGNIKSGFSSLKSKGFKASLKNLKFANKLKPRFGKKMAIAAAVIGVASVITYSLGGFDKLLHGKKPIKLSEEDDMFKNNYDGSKFDDFTFETPTFKNIATEAHTKQATTKPTIASSTTVKTKVNTKPPTNEYISQDEEKDLDSDTNGDVDIDVDKELETIPMTGKMSMKDFTYQDKERDINDQQGFSFYRYGSIALVVVCGYIYITYNDNAAKPKKKEIPKTT